MEHEYSDRLLEKILAANLPDRYGHKLQVSSIPQVNLDLLPHAALERIANGEHILSVLVSLLEACHDLDGVLEPGEPTKEIVQR